MFVGVNMMFVVLFAVPSYRHPFSNVPCVKPAVAIQGLCCFLRILQVPFEHVFTLDANLRDKENLRG